MFQSSVDKYYQMSDSELKQEGLKSNIKPWESYGPISTWPPGGDERSVMIEKLLKKDAAKENRITLFVALGSLVISIIALFK